MTILFTKVATMSDMKCPFCQQELQETFGIIKQFWCSNYYNHTHPINLQGTKELWQELIRTRKALDVAVDALNKINMRCQNTVRNHLERATIRGELCDISFYARKAIGDIDNLERITALEQKD